MQEPNGPGKHRSDAREVTHHFRLFLSLQGTEIASLFKQAADEWIDDKAPRLGAALAFYTLLSTAPLLVVAVAIAAVAFGKTAVEGQLFWQMQSFMGTPGATAVQGLIQSADKFGTGLFATSLGLLVLLFAASSVVLELEDALNTIWHLPTPPTSGGWGGLVSLLKSRLYSFGIVLGTGLLLLVSLVLNTLTSLVGSLFSSWLPVSALMLHFVEFILAFGATTMLFATIYKVMPAVRLNWSDVAVGACVTSLLFTIGKQLIAVYLGNVGFASTYGAAGSLVAILVWVYYSAQLFFLGAEFTKVYARRFGSKRTTGRP